MTSCVVTGLQGLPLFFPRAKSSESSVTSSSLPMGWALQKPRAGGTRYSAKVKEYLKARFDAGEEPILCKLPLT